jgi:small-conductance mechanosensitive channel
MSDVENIFWAGLNQASGVLANFWSVWTLYQAGIILSCLAVGWFLARIWTPPLEHRIRRLTGQPRLMRLLVIPLRRLSWIMSATLLWVIALVMQELTWPSRSYLVVLAAQLVGAWVLINIASRMIRNRSIAQLIAVVAWVVAALAIIGYLDDVSSFLDGIALTVGSKRVTVLALLKGVFAFALLIWIAFVLSDFFDGRLRLVRDLTPTYQVLVSKFIRAALLIMAVLMALEAIGVDLTALAVFSGALGIGLGFGLQKIAANLISGIIILLDKSIKPGDVITVGDTFGWITRLQSRYVSVNTRDGVEHLIPNETLISESVINWSHSNRRVRLDIHIGVSYGDDPHVVRRIVVEAIRELERVIESPSPVCHITGFGDSSIDFIVRFWIADPENGTTNIRGTAYLAIWDTFKEHGVTIPFPHRQVLISDADQKKISKSIGTD